MIEHLDIEALESLSVGDSSSALVVDLTKLGVLRASPVPHITKICSCVNTDFEFAHHCIKCGASYAKIKEGLNSYELYSIIYKFIEIYSKEFDTVAFISDSIIPLDFVGSLNKLTWISLPNLPYRRNIIHISNSIVHTDDFFTRSGLAEQVRDKIYHLSIFSDSKSVMEIHRAKIIHSSRFTPSGYLNLILGSCGSQYKYLLS